jgi:hypothetical protein
VRLIIKICITLECGFHKLISLIAPYLSSQMLEVQGYTQYTEDIMASAVASDPGAGAAARESPRKSISKI